VWGCGLRRIKADEEGMKIPKGTLNRRHYQDKNTLTECSYQGGVFGVVKKKSGKSTWEGKGFPQGLQREKFSMERAGGKRVQERWFRKQNTLDPGPERVKLYISRSLKKKPPKAQGKET